MKYQIKEIGDFEVEAKTPLFALRKGIRKLLSRIQKKNGDIYDIKGQTITLVNQFGDPQIYLVTILPYSGPPKSIYYKFEYEIEVYKKLNVI